MPDESSDILFRNMCLHAGVAMIATDNQLRIRFWNLTASRIFGGSPEAMLGQPITSIVPGDRRELAERLFARTLDKAEISEFEFRHRNPAGQPTHLAVTVSPIIDEQGRHAGVSITIRDVTRRIELERSAATAEKMSALGSMAGQVAHHFNNLIGGIITSLDFAQNSDDPEVMRRALHNSAAALERASHLTRGLLAFAEGDRSDRRADDLIATLQTFLNALQPILVTEKITLQTNLKPVHVLVPAKRMLTILESLTTNAREAMPHGGTLRIDLGLSADEQTILLEITDTGVGIPPEDMQRVFEPFFTSKAQNDLVQPAHAGLGLAVVHGIIKDLGGTVALYPGIEGGTVCTIQLPVKMSI